MTHPPATARFRARRALRIAALVVVALPTLAASGRATTITYAGSLLDLGAGWRTDTVSKGKFGLNGSNVLGNDGYQLFGTNLAAVVPGYLTMSVKTTSYNAAAVGNGSYYSVDNPTTTPGGSPSKIETGALNPRPGANVSATMLTFTTKGTVPAVIQVGLMVDNVDKTGVNSTATQLTGTGTTGSRIVSLTGASYNDLIPDWVFFDITGAVANETFTLTNWGGANGPATLGGIAFDSRVTSSQGVSVPEPASIVVLGVGLLGLGAARRRGTAGSIRARFSRPRA